MFFPTIKLKTRTMLLVGVWAGIGCAALIVFATVQARRQMHEEALDKAREMAFHHAGKMESLLSDAMGTTRTIALMLQATLVRREGFSRQTVIAAIEQVVKSKPLYFGIWVQYEPHDADGKDGSFMPYVYREQGEVVTVYESGTWDKFKQKNIVLLKKTGFETVLNPYREPDAGNALMTSLCVPLYDGSDLVGAVGMDLMLGTISGYISRIQSIGEGYAFLVANDGTFIGHPRPDMIGRKLSEFSPRPETLEAIKNGQEASEMKTHPASGAPYYVYFVPVRIGSAQNPWSFAVNFPMDQVLYRSSVLMWRLITIGLGVTASILIALFLVVRSITNPIHKVIEFITGPIAVGDLGASLECRQQGEIGNLCAALNALVLNLRSISDSAEKIARGDLTADVRALSDKDVLGHALRAMIGRLSEVVAEINISAGNVSLGAGQLKTSSQAISRGAAEQASSLEQIASSMHEVATQTRQNARNASQASMLAGEAREAARKGDRQITIMVSAMQQIAEASRNISRIIKVIDEIAFQTNLLALNAAVEAARAGRHGKGFAVVAEEVRSLAARSAQAARETSEMIESAVAHIDNGTIVAAGTADALQEILKAAGKVTDLVVEIAAASNEQAQSAAQITTALTQVDGVTQQNSAHAQENAAQAQQLSGQSDALQKLVATFVVPSQMSSGRSAQADQHTPALGTGCAVPAADKQTGFGLLLPAAKKETEEI